MGKERQPRLVTSESFSIQTDFWIRSLLVSEFAWPILLLGSFNYLKSYVRVKYCLMWLNLLVSFWSKFNSLQFFKSLQLWSYLSLWLLYKCFFGEYRFLLVLCLDTGNTGNTADIKCDNVHQSSPALPLLGLLNLVAIAEWLEGARDSLSLLPGSPCSSEIHSFCGSLRVLYIYQGPFYFLLHCTEYHSFKLCWLRFISRGM